MCACVAGGGFLGIFDFLTSLQSQGYLTPLCSPSCVHESPACNAPLTQFSIQSYACTVMVIGSTTLASPPPRDLWFHKDGVSTFLPWSAFTQLSIGCTYLSQLAVIAFFFPSVNLSMSFVTFTHLIAAEHLHNIRLPRHCHQRFFFPCHRPVCANDKDPDTYGCDGSSHPNNETWFRTKFRLDHLMYRVIRICAPSSRVAVFERAWHVQNSLTGTSAVR
jgi:hypothetical protein